MTCRDAFFGGAVGGGKTVALLAAALQYVDIPGYNAILIRDTLSNLNKPDSLIDLSFKQLVNTDAAWQGTKNRWVFPSGATLNFGYLDSPKAHFQYQSAQYQFVGIDEIVNIRQNQAEFMFSRMRKLKGSPIPIRFRCASNPPLSEQIERGAWVKAKYITPETRDKGTVFIPAFMEDNPHLDMDDYRESLAKLDPITRAKFEKGDWEISVKGKMFLREWFSEIVEVAPVNARTVRYWDLAATAKKQEDINKPAYTAGAKLCIDENKQYYVMDMVRIQGSPLTVEKLIRTTAAMDGQRVEIMMEQEPGSSGVNTIDHYRRHVLSGYVFNEDKVTGSKIERARPFASQVEAGNVKLVRGAWIKDFVYEFEMFPNSEFKDQVDSTSGAFNRLALSGFFRVSRA